jgi:hypothetical protein
MKQRIARIKMSDCLLKEFLHFPQDTEILFIKKSDFNEIEIDVIHKDLKEIEINECGEPPIITPKYTKMDFFQTINFDWNQK